MNIVYRDLILARVQAAIGDARAVTGIGHQGLKGQLREIVIRDLLRPLLPADISLGTGEIITASNHHSQQQDIVMYDKSIVPPILLEATTGVFPIESVLYAIEIKSQLTAPEAQSAIENANQLRSLKYIPGVYDSDDEMDHSTMKAVIPTILAFRSDLSGNGKTELDRFKENWDSTIKEPPIQIICVVDHGCWTWRPEDEWRAWPITYPHEEVVTFIAVLMNSYKMLALSRKAPRLGHYLF